MTLQVDVQPTVVDAGIRLAFCNTLTVGENKIEISQCKRFKSQSFDVDPEIEIESLQRFDGDEALFCNGWILV